MANEKEKLSQGDICLTKSETVMTFTNDQFSEVDDGLYQITVKMEHRAWECPFCGKSQEYHLINGLVVNGCGGSGRIGNGKISDACIDCREEQDNWHSG